MLYFHGGPGFSSLPEKSLLVPAFQAEGLALVTWDEPSNQRPNSPRFKSDNAFQNYLDEAEVFLSHYYGLPLTLIGHSYGAHPVAIWQIGIPLRSRRLSMLALRFALSPADANIFKIAIADFKKEGDPRATALEEISCKLTGKFDANTLSGYEIAAADPALFTHYWVNKTRMMQFLPLYQGPDALDLNAFVGIRMSHAPIEVKLSAIPTVAIFGKQDRVISNSHELAVLRDRCSDLTTYEFKESGHYPHIEETARFIEVVRNEIGRKASPFVDLALQT